MWSSISINFVPITQFLLENDKKQEWCAFCDLTVITRTNELNQVSASSLLEDINFPLQGVVVVTCWDTSPSSPQHKMGFRPCRQLQGMLHFRKKSLYIFCSLPPTYTTAHCRDVVGKEKHDVCCKKLSEGAKKGGKNLSKWNIKHQQMLKARYYFALMSLQIIWLWIELPQLRGQCETDFVFCFFCFLTQRKFTFIWGQHMPGHLGEVV